MNFESVVRPMYELHINIRRKSARADRLERIVSEGLNPKQWKIIKKELNVEKHKSYEVWDDVRNQEKRSIILI